MIKDTFMFNDDDKDGFRFEAEDFNSLAALHTRYDLLDEKDRVNPDKFGCECLFIRFFVNDDMSRDFAIIANTFYKNVPEAMDCKNYRYFTDTQASDSSLIDAFIEFTLGQIYSFASAGNEYASKLLLYLYKTYYKKEYKILKKFRKISRDEVLSIAWESTRTDGLGDRYFQGPSRILIMCQFMNIEPDISCSFMYYVMTEINKKIEKSLDEKRYPHFQDDSEEDDETEDEFRDRYYSTGDELKKIFEVEELRDIEGKCKLYKRYKKFINDYYTEKGANIAEERAFLNSPNFVSCMIKTYMLLKDKHPNREYTPEDLQNYTMIYMDHHIKDEITDQIETHFMLTLGEVDEYILEDSMFIPDDFEKASGLLNWKDKKSVKPEVHKEPEKKVSDVTSYDQQVLLEQITDLRDKLHKKEYDIHRLSELYSDAKQRIAESENYKEKYESEHSELITLREHVYNETEEEIEIPEKTVKEYKKAIENKKIIIIGGHANWVNKMKEIFKNWTFVNFKSTSTIDDNILNSNTEYVFFFTDFIKHHVYYRFINLVREKNIPFGYIGTININKCIKQIADEISAANK